MPMNGCTILHPASLTAFILPTGGSRQYNGSRRPDDSVSSKTKAKAPGGRHRSDAPRGATSPIRLALLCRVRLYGGGYAQHLRLLCRHRQAPKLNLDIQRPRSELGLPGGILDVVALEMGQRILDTAAVHSGWRTVR